MNPVQLNENLSRFTELGIYGAMLFYAAAFVVMSLSLIHI